MIKLILKLLILPGIGLVFIVVPMVMAIQAFQTRDLVTMDVPGTKTFEVKQADQYTVWHRVIGVTDNSEFRVTSNDLPSGLAVHIRRASDGTTVPLKNAMGSTLHNGSTSKKSLVNTDLVAGKYEIVGTTTGDHLTLVVSKNPFSFKGLFLVLGCLATGILLLIGGGIYAVFKVVQRLTSRPTAPSPSAL